MMRWLDFIADRLDRKWSKRHYRVMDVLTEWLQTLRGNELMLAHSAHQPPWGISLSGGGKIVFHLINQGQAWLRRPGQPPLPLTDGDLVVVTDGTPHDIVNPLDSPALPVGASDRRFGTAGPADPHQTVLFCGQFQPDPRSVWHANDALPGFIHMSSSCLAEEPAIAGLIRLLAHELETPSIGSQQLARHLTDSLFICVLRAAARYAGHGKGWLSAIEDRYLTKAFAAMHAEPSASWTVAALAQKAGLSRAAFARRFADLVGQPPLAYLTAWRMSLASRLLAEASWPLSIIAEKTGYTSEAAFSRAFKRQTGLAPAAYRRSRVPVAASQAA